MSAPPQVCIHPLNHHQSQPSPSKPAPPRPKYSSRAPPSHAEGFTLPFVQHCSQPSTRSKATSSKNSQSRNICKNKVANIGLTSHFVQQIRDLHTFFSQLLPPFEPRCHFFSAPPSRPVSFVLLLYTSSSSAHPVPLLLKCAHTTHCAICWHTCAPSQCKT